MTSMVTGMEDPGSLREAFSNSFVMILVTELGDKTFFIAALLAMRNDRLAVWAGAAGALAAMTALSACIGLVLPSLLPRKYTHWAAVALFVYFGAKLLFEAVQMLRSGTGKGPSDELEEVEQELKDGSSKEKKSSAVALQALTLTFLAEWGDRSQIATIALAAAKDPLGVTLAESSATHAAQAWQFLVAACWLLASLKELLCLLEVSFSFSSLFMEQLWVHRTDTSP
eukprot:CAMPEP_0197660774 /NCGR_PEP_ID=MMETSP1338-20131121/51054_1 /TAXON_ID=43686 ORGANISM="Pelagodinium beii, Strain RCC1491" /NCGR_SAMPLE_ID=MMETSP1338 /ASSEMBLY_ACC=CAM_ASM_000754 /LENGTH=226 /DNA_ID=CAMNT_0043238199 /DNA_START=144 /DNA_END=825 /DNA_ORIENTATION=-